MVNGKIGICVVGAGRAGMIHAENYMKRVPDAVTVAVVDPVKETAEQAAEKLGIDTWYENCEQSFQDSRIDAYIIVSPTKYHVGIATAIAEQRKHILCEKPMAMDEVECDVMIDAAKKNNVKLQIGFMRRFDSGFIRAKDMIDTGMIGDVVMVRSNTRGPSIPRPWMYDISKSNGPLAEVNSHDIDTMRWFTGSEFHSLYAIGGNYRCPDAKKDWPDFYDNVVMAASFKNGMQGMLDGAQGVGYAYDAKVEVIGTKGSIQIGSLKGDQVVYCSSETKTGTYPLVSSWTDLFREAYLNEDLSFVSSIINNTETRVTGVDGKMAVKVVDAGNRSIKEQRIVTL